MPYRHIWSTCRIVNMPYRHIWSTCRIVNFEGVWPRSNPFFWFKHPERNEFPLRVLTIRAAAYLGDVRGDADVFPLWITYIHEGKEDYMSLNPGSPVARELMNQLKKWARKLGPGQQKLAADIGEVGSLVDLASEFIDILMAPKN